MKCPITIFNYQIVKNSANSKAEIFIDGDIVDASSQEIMKNWWGDETSVSYRSFRNELLNCGVTDVDVYVNSYGGHVGDAMAMHDLITDLNNKGWNINTYGRGMVCSSATYLVMAGKNGGSVSANTSWLIHNVSGGIWGNVNEIENYAKTMRKFNDMIVDFYANKTGLSKAVVTDWMNNETWLMGQEIKDKGFVTESTGDAAVKNVINPEQWPFANKAILNKYNSSIQNSNNDTMKTVNEMLDAFRNEMKALFNSGKKPEDMAEAITNALETVVNGVAANQQEAIDTAVNAATTGEAFTTAVNTAAVNAVNAALATVPKNITDAIAAATTGFVNEAKFETLLTNIGDKLGKPAGNKNKLDPEDQYAHEGVQVEV
jgi:ATP-dependent Clp protease protease subunit